MNEFPKRFYRHPIHLFRDVGALFMHAPRARLRHILSPAFRERLMLAVTAVNACRYCAHLHAQVALTAGLRRDEIAQRLGGEFAAAPARELPALLYAQHWAEMNAQPAPAVRAQFVAAYGDETARAIESVLRMIRIGNLLGNTFDYVLYPIFRYPCLRICL